MPIQVELVRDHRVVLQTYSDPLDRTDLNHLSDQMLVILGASTRKVHIIADFRAVKHLPSLMVSSGISMLRRTHVNTGVIVCVPGSAFIASMAQLFTTLSRWNIIIVPTLEAAYLAIDALLAADSSTT
jgi:hypothetical protein